MQVQRCKDAKLHRRYRLQSYKVMQKCRGAKVQRCKGAKVQGAEVQRRCIGADRCRGAEAEVQVQRCSGGERSCGCGGAEVHSEVHSWCSGGGEEGMQRGSECAGADIDMEVQRC